MTEPEPKSQKEKPETDLSDDELEKVAGGASVAYPPGPSKVAQPPGPPNLTAGLGAVLEPPGPPTKIGVGSPRDP